MEIFKENKLTGLQCGINDDGEVFIGDRQHKQSFPDSPENRCRVYREFESSTVGIVDGSGIIINHDICKRYVFPCMEEYERFYWHIYEYERANWCPEFVCGIMFNTAHSISHPEKVGYIEYEDSNGADFAYDMDDIRKHLEKSRKEISVKDDGEPVVNGERGINLSELLTKDNAISDGKGGFSVILPKGEKDEASNTKTPTRRKRGR